MTNEEVDVAIVARLKIGPCRFVLIRAAIPGAAVIDQFDLQRVVR